VLGISGSQAVMQNVLLDQLTHRITGPGSAKTIKGIRESVEYLAKLDPQTRALAIQCYTVAFRAAFGALIGVAACAVLSAAIGIGAKKGGEDKEEATEPPLSEGIPVLE
jgi:hypothetical protein